MEAAGAEERKKLEQQYHDKLTTVEKRLKDLAEKEKAAKRDAAQLVSGPFTQKTIMTHYDPLYHQSQLIRMTLTWAQLDTMRTVSPAYCCMHVASNRWCSGCTDSVGR